MSFIYNYSIPDIKCNACAAPIRRLLTQEASSLGLVTFNLNVDEKRIYIESTLGGGQEHVFLEQLNTELEKIGFNASLDVKAVKTAPRSYYFKGGLGLIVGLMMSFSMYLFPSMGILVTLSHLFISIGLTTYLGWDAYQDAWRSLIQRKTLTMDTLFSVSTLTILVSSILSLKFPFLPHMFDASLLILGFRHLGKGIEESLKEKMDLKIKFQDRASTLVKMLASDELRHASDLFVNDEVIFTANQVLSVDGISLNDRAWVFKTIANGSTVSELIKRGEPLLAGMKLDTQSGPLHLKVTAKANQSYLSRLDSELLLTQQTQAPIEKKAHAYLQYFIPTVLGISILSGLLIGVFFSPVAGIQCAVSILVSACPCTLGLITPLLMQIGIQKGYEKGIRFKSGEMLERAAEIEAIVFDLNGTLTTGLPEVQDFIVCGAAENSKDLLKVAYTLENQNNHAIAHALKRYCKKMVEGVVLDTVQDTDITPFPGGVGGSVAGEQWYMGNKTMLKSLHIDPPYEEMQGDTVIYMVKNNQIYGYFVVNDPLRPHAINVIAALQKQNKKIFMCTGADEETALCYARKLGLPADAVVSNAVPGEEGENPKIAFIKHLKNSYKVAMVGDAGNDALAVKESHFGIAMHSKSTDEMTKAQAGAILVSDELTPILHTFQIAKETLGQINKVLMWSLIYNLLSVFVVSAVFLGLGYLLHPCLGAGFMMLQTSLILLKAYHYKHQPLEEVSKPDTLSSDSHQQMNKMGLGSVEDIQALYSQHNEAPYEPLQQALLLEQRDEKIQSPVLRM